MISKKIKRITFIVSICIILFGVNAIAQTSLWKDAAPYSENKGPGDIVTLRVQERFILETNDRNDGSTKQEIRLEPDTRNLPFLNPSTQSKSIERVGKSRYRMRETLKFSLAVQLLEPGQNQKTLPIRGSFTFDIDSKPGRILVTGEVDPRHIRNGILLSENVYNLSMRVQVETPFPSDNRLQLKPPNAAVAEPNTAQLSPQEEQDILLRHLRRIIGGQER